MEEESRCALVGQPRMDQGMRKEATKKERLRQRQGTKSLSLSLSLPLPLCVCMCVSHDGGGPKRQSMHAPSMLFSCGRRVRGVCSLLAKESLQSCASRGVHHLLECGGAPSVELVGAAGCFASKGVGNEAMRQNTNLVTL